jgi:hypothetical protein
MHIIQLDDYVAHQLDRASYTEQRRLLPRIALSLGVLAVAVTVIGLVSRLRTGSAPGIVWWVAAVLAAAAGLAGGALALYVWAYRTRSAERDQLRAGLAGQRVVPDALDDLDDRFFVINGLKLPGRGDDVDHVVVGPTGVFALETKHRRGRIFWRAGQWYQAKTSQAGWTQPEAPMRDPVRQLKRNIDYMRSCINSTDERLSRRTRLWIEGAVVFTHPDVQIDLPPELAPVLPFPVLHVRDLPAHIADHVPRQSLRHAEVRHIVSLLAHLGPPASGAPAAAREGVWYLSRHPSTARRSGTARQRRIR